MELERSDLDSNCWECNDDATTWVHMSDGLRRYFCADCITDIFRHDKDPEDIDGHPQCSHCRSCGCLTLREHCPANACPECQSEDSGEEYLETIEEAAEEYSEVEAELTEDGITVADE